MTGKKWVICLGRIEEMLIFVAVHTDRNGITWIISARSAKRLLPTQKSPVSIILTGLSTG
jgi:hypothetical protein